MEFLGMTIPSPGTPMEFQERQWNSRESPIPPCSKDDLQEDQQPLHQEYQQEHPELERGKDG